MMTIKQLFKYVLAFSCTISLSVKAQTLTNFNSKGQQVTRFSKLGDAIDAHDGEIAYFNGTYYLYGTSYGCGFEWGHKDAPFCGFQVYTSKDMVNWTDWGPLFDTNTPVWQTRCNGNTYGCFRPHVIYNEKTKRYVLWINVYDNRVGYRVFTSEEPVGPFIEQAEPKLAVNSEAAVAGLNNGDHDTFVDDDGKAYLAYTDWHAKGAIAIEQLTDDYLSGTGKVIQAITQSRTEAPSLFKRKGIYYLIYSDPNCGYCSGTGASYRTAKSPLGPWSDGIKISDNSCGGQPSFVSSIKLKTGDVFLFGSDLWNNAAKNESLANYYWAPLKFNEDGSIKPIECENTVAIPAAAKTAKASTLNYAPGCDINATTKRTSAFKAIRTGLLTTLHLSVFKSAYPDSELQIAISADGDETPLKVFKVKSEKINWSPKNLILYPEVKVTRGKSYTISVSSTTSKGCYGLEYDRATMDSAEPAFLYKIDIASR